MAKGGRAVAGIALRTLQTLFYFLAFLTAAAVLGIYSWFLASLSHNHEHIPARYKAIEGIAGAAVLYTIFAMIFTLFLGGISVFAAIGILLDVLFIGGFIAVAWYTRGGAGKCRGHVSTPLGSGNTGTDLVNGHPIRTICKLQTAAFALAIIACFLFLVCALFQMVLAANHRKEKRYGPSPSNNYKSGSGRTPFWKRGGRKNRTTQDAELATATVGTGAALGAGRHHHDRVSNDTGYTGETLGHTGPLHEPKYGEPGYGQGIAYTNGPAYAHHHTTQSTNY